MRNPEAHGNGDARTNGSRSPQELHQDIERHRENLDRTISELGDKLSPGELLDEGLRYMKSGPGEFFGNLMRTARDNPVPMALTGIGLAWLMVGQRNSGSDVAAPKGEYDVGETARQGGMADLYAQYLEQEYPFEEDEIDAIIYEDLGSESLGDYQARSGRGGTRTEEWREKGSSAASQASEKAGEWSEKARSRAGELGEQARARIDSARARMAAASADVRERSRRARDNAWRRARQARHSTASRARSAAHQAGDLIERYPLSLIAVGLAAGTALGTALPETRREDRMFGKTSDELKGRARDELQAQTERGRRTAAAARDAAMAEARAQGLSGEGLREEGRELRERAEQVAKAARAEAERQGLSAAAVEEEVHRAREKVERVAAAARDAARQEQRDNG
ncbi:MAG: DUF3618 domain-containing protein [Thiogranum sp.]|nr:DUF3618 domain-containing protein [Thiogranum sp.]